MINQLKCWYTNFQQLQLPMESIFMVWTSSRIETVNLMEIWLFGLLWILVFNLIQI